MRLLVEYDTTTRVVVVSIDEHEATVADLTRALDFVADSPTWIDGSCVDPDARLVDLGLSHGSVVSQRAPIDPDAPDQRVRVAVTRGPDAGRVLQSGDGDNRIGRDPGGDLVIDNPTVSGVHARLSLHPELLIEDLGSRNGTWVDGTRLERPRRLEEGDEVRLGSSRVIVRSLESSDRPLGIDRRHGDTNGRVLINRPPREIAAPEPGPVTVPLASPKRAMPALPIVAVLAPLVMSAVLVVVLGSWRFAIFALLSPVMVLGNHLSGRRRVRRLLTSDSAEHEQELDRFERSLAAAREFELNRRRVVAPDLAEVRRRIELPSTRLWERRLDAPDAMVFGLGLGAVDWKPAIDNGERDAHDELADLVHQYSGLEDSEVLADLRLGPLGIVGDAATRSATARSVVLQASCHHGPGDLQLAVFIGEERVDEWAFVQWIPHSEGNAGSVRLFAGDAGLRFAASLLERIDGGGLTEGWLIVIDDVDLVHGRSSPVRRLLERTDAGVFGVVLASSRDQLPASIATVATLADDSGEVAIDRPSSPEGPSVGIADLPSIRTAQDLARALARYEDPDERLGGSTLPTSVGLPILFDYDPSRAEALRARWSTGGDDLVAPIGFGYRGVMTLDLVSDGPHALIAGTTGSGKSEFLRTLVLGLALEHGPDDLVFVLIDYKGGSAFDRCADLPHVVGMVTDLDGHLAQRALASLDAELRHREGVLRSADASDVSGYRARGAPAGSLPRLVVVIDEFATLRSEVPQFIESLVAIAQRGRSLGVHLVLATQRPSGAVDANIRANTNLRVALRMQDASDSLDVIDDRCASEIDGGTPGRAYVRRGNSEPVPVQTAYGSSAASTEPPPVRVARVTLGSGMAPVFDDPESIETVTQLDLLVDAAIDAAAGSAPPRRPWLDDLPLHIGDGVADQLESIDGAPVRLAVGDDPELQRRVVCGWHPGVGPLLVHGMLGSGVSTLIRSAVAALPAGPDGRDVWVYAVDHGAGGLAGIDAHAHVERVIEANEVERQLRLLDMLTQFVDCRRQGPAGGAHDMALVVVAIDGLAAYLETVDPDQTGEGPARFAQILRDGPAVGVSAVLGAGPSSDVPRSIAPLIRQRWVMEMADVNEYQLLGVRGRALPTFHPGRVLIGPDPLVAQVIDVAVDASATSDLRRPPVVEPLPVVIERSSLGQTARLDRGVSIPFAIDDRSRGPASLELGEGEHALIVGPARSGRTTVLRTIAEQIRDVDPESVLVWVSEGSMPAHGNGLVDAHGNAAELHDVLSMAPSDERRWIVLIDDAERLEESAVLLDLVRPGAVGVTVVAAARNGALRNSYRHWLRHLGSSGIGLLLNPENSIDGEILGVRLPRNEALARVPGRGYLVHGGESVVVQVAC